MDLKHYFENTEGIGVLATCEPEILVDQAIYSKPLVVEVNVVAFIMKERVSHKNLRSHLKASYLFLENGSRSKGVRLHLTMQHEEENRSLIESIRAKKPEIFQKEDDSSEFLVFFEVDQVRPLVGNKFV